MTLSRRKLRDVLPRRRITIHHALEILAVPVGCNARNDVSYFWQRPESLLLEYLDRARSNYMQMIKNAGNTGEDAVTLNVAWRTVRQRFAKKGLELP